MKTNTISIILTNDELSHIYGLVNSCRRKFDYAERSTIDSWMRRWSNEYRSSNKYCIVFRDTEVYLLYMIVKRADSVRYDWNEIVDTLKLFYNNYFDSESMIDRGYPF